MINLEQIKADIAARKSMPAWGAHTSIERIRTINATLPSFSLKTVEALVEMLENSQRANAAQSDHITQQQDRIDVLEKRNAELGKYVGELKSRTVKLPERYSCELGYNSPDPNGEMLDRDDVIAALTAAGINWRAP
ncbi:MULTISPECIES: hypothetical protein [Klebsiella]|uniref:hypothetical protein n=1 Tax=Klebsiella TaxID=570 RepID=UPI00066821D5|nr:hypothetical protein [Klebsiella variicola]HCI6319655.1 hypothetical protein [Klebsiella quasipneumoniae subsp. similipneumoniae]HEJ7924881.1 hypothetical protein [Klebsiella michiganensis]